MSMDTDKFNSYVEALNNSIKTFLVEEKSTYSKSRQIDDFVVYLERQESEIKKFRGVETDIVAWLNLYDFEKGSGFDAIRHGCDSLYPIEEGIAKIKDLIKSLHNRPDRYGLSAQIKACNDYMKFCFEQMKMSDIDKSIAEINKRISGLQSIIACFQKEDDCLDRIKRFINGNRPLLQKYPAYTRELKSFIDAFPHEKLTDLAQIEKFVEHLKNIDQKFGALEQAWKDLSQYAARLKGTEIESAVMSTSTTTKAALVHSQLSQTDSQLANQIVSLKNLKRKYDKEAADLSLIHKLIGDYETLLNRYPVYYQEIRDYLKGFPHDGNLDYRYVKQHIDDLGVIDAKFNMLSNVLKSISGWIDRFGKQEIEKSLRIILDNGPKTLVYQSLNRVDDIIEKTMARVKAMQKGFDDEERQLRRLYQNITNSGASMWQEDEAAIGRSLKNIIDADVRKSRFDVNSILAARDNAVQKKRLDVESVRFKYPWLKRDRYQQQFQNLSVAKLSYAEFLRRVEDMKEQRSLFTRLVELIFYR